MNSAVAEAVRLLREKGGHQGHCEVASNRRGERLQSTQALPEGAEQGSLNSFRLWCIAIPPPAPPLETPSEPLSLTPYIPQQVSI